MLILVPILALLCSVSFWLILGRPRFLSHGSGEVGRISVIVPARNEEENIGGLLDSLAGQGIEEVIVVDDGSGDRTAEVARAKGARVVVPGELPEGWKGKPWACQQGAAAAAGEWFLFLDADTRLEQGGMGAIAGLLEDEEQVYSICPYHRIESPVEECSAFFNVLMVAGAGAFGWKTGVGEALFGQCLLISARHHEAVGGHERVRGEILENFHLAKVLEKEGIGRRCFLGRGVLRMRMFSGGMGELWKSWQKGFAAGAGSAARCSLFWSSVWISGAMLALVGMAMALLPTTSTEVRVIAWVAYGLYVLQCLRAFRLVGNFSVWNALFFPLSLLFYQVLFFVGLWRRKAGKTTEWKGRHVA